MNIYTAFAVHISIIPTLHIPLKRVSLLQKFLSVQLLRSQCSISAVRLFNLGGQGVQFATEYSVYDMQVIGKAKVHGIEGVELTARESSYSDKTAVINRTFIAQLTDDHCRYLAAFRNDGDVRNYITFLDGDEFLQNWGFGEDNCGNETNLMPKGDIQRSGNVVSGADKAFLLDIVGRYTVAINGKSYDTVCVMDIETYSGGIVSEQFLDKSGKTILWRRFNRDDWAFDHYKKKWSEQLPENERLIVNGNLYVHWYDCITDYIL